MMSGRTLGIRGVRGVRPAGLRLFAVAMALGAIAVLIGAPAARADEFNPFSPSGGSSPSSASTTSGVSAKLVPSVDSTPTQNQFVLDISDAPTVTEGTAGQNKTATFTVTLSQPSTQVISVAFSTLAGTATAGQD